MARRRKVRPDRILILLLLFVLIVLLIILGVKTLFKDINNEGDEVNINEVVENNTTVEIIDYDVYIKDDDLGFGFIVANLKVSDTTDLQTEEAIRLSEVFNYENKLRTSGYDFDALTVNNDIHAGEVRVFIPFVNKDSSLNVIDINSNYSIIFDLTKNNKNIDSLIKQQSEGEIVSKEYTFRCQKPYIEDMMKHNDEPYDSSMLSIYVFRLNCESIKDGIKVTSATFTDLNGNVFDAYDSSYSSSKVENIIGKSLKENDTYALFFELYSNEEDRVSYEGTINLKFSDGSSANVKTVMN